MSVAPLDPAWARLSRGYEQRLPNHFGKRTLLRMLRALPERRGSVFVSRMENGALLAFTPAEAATWTAGWTAFVERRWEPHVERCLRELLRPGDTALDIGANQGYFSAVMAQVVGRGGRVVSFEPVRPTFERLLMCRALNGFDQMTTFQLALGAADGRVEIAYDRAFGGSASLHGDGPQRERVAVRRLDSLVAAGFVPRPDVIKLDVEGHELAVLEGALETVRQAQPAIVFEWNEDAAARAGWTLREASELLRSVGDYDFWAIGDASLEPIDPAVYRADGSRYAVDVLARSASR